MHKSKRVLLIALSLVIVIAVTGFAYFALFADLPSIDTIPEHLNEPSTRITDRNKRPLYEILPRVGGRHAVISLKNTAACMPQATIAVEDNSFYTNPGLDLVGMLRALWINLQGGQTVAGGSTITQQAVRNLLLKDEIAERTLQRKLREMILAWQLTHTFSKDEILALYLNQTFYGGFAYGIEAAARTYFGKPASDLLLAECALLAGLPQAPALYNPFEYPQAAKRRQEIVLALMEKGGYITSLEHQQAEQTPLNYNASPFPIRAPHFVWMIKSQIDELMKEQLLDPRTSLVVQTSLDLNAQAIAEVAIARQIEKFTSQKELDQNVNNAAVVVMDAHNGEILALVGSADYFDASIFGALNMATNSRQPGSAFKPFIYAEAFNPVSPEPWTAATPILDVQTIFTSTNGQPYIPRNYDEREHGIVSARLALASSLNIPAVATLEKVGVPNMIRLANRMGISMPGTPDQYGLPLALGGGEMSLLELTNAYAIFANGGLLPHRSTILEIRDADDNLIYKPTQTPQTQIFDPRVAWLISDILSDDNARMLGFGQNSTLNIERPAAIKTGTTDNYHDNWAVGYTPSLVVGVWVGNSDFQAMRNVNGLTGAAPIWQETIRGLLRGKPVETFTRPQGLVQVEVCAYSGLIATSLCDRSGLEWFINETKPIRNDDIYRQIWLDTATGNLATNHTPISQRESLTVLHLPIKAQRWARSQGLKLYSDFSPADREASELVLISPQPGSAYHISERLETTVQQIPVEALASTDLTKVSIWVDGFLLEQFKSQPFITWWSLEDGPHRLWAEGLDAGGQIVRSNVVEIVVTK